jgi:UDP-N-acetylmuramyl pentapeptide phosphotransferase/UDP-N-acetylglucosamine-1-phosphate transferase
VLLPAFGGLVAASFVLSLFGCVAVKRAALRLRLVDVPNERSLHRAPVPRLGGVAMVVSVWIVLGVGAIFVPILRHGNVVAWLASASAIAVLGFVDDVRPLSALPRLMIQVAAATGLLAFALRGGTIALAAGLRVNAPAALLVCLAVLFVVGTTNIYNFMDGMDGLAATQTVSAGIALGAACVAGGQTDLALVSFVIAAASAGFWVHNAPPATLFLGDAGSTFVGFSFSALGLMAAARPSPVPLGVVPVALAPFLLDGTFTMIRRLRAGERVWQPHRTHLYQRAVGAGLTHRDVLVVYAGWSATAAAAAVWVAQGGATRTCVAGLAMVGSLVLVWRWVVRLEQR